ncbi:hypothetical protein [Streptomyces hokutonensis]|uniref:hypothetical protein n=1 Tax=Streptomyces hokutonensis TaxID=1306990 RepID=UPI0036ACB757
MAQLKIRDLYGLLRQAPRRQDLQQHGIRLVYDGTALYLSTAAHPDTVIARASTCGFTTGPREATAYGASITSVEVWLRINPEYGDHLIDVSPFWPTRPAMIAFTAGGGHTAAFPVIACPTAPADRRP